ncbi:MAG TPA: helix-turn-helix domain-containing protein [Candidatus Bariatricus faecipullorum]|nr:helix-turn-helix domain-containing protein [Candidatus Bariatricus faecipullorum]
MEMTIGKQIQKYRKQNNMTQEQMAEALGVSTAAVSKWETQVTCPDITMLAPLARLLRITVDELLDFRGELEKETCMELVKKGERLFADGRAEKAREYCEKLLQEYPRDLFLKFRIAGGYMMYLGEAGDQKEQNRQRDRAIRLFEDASRSGEREISDAAWYTLAGLYLMKGDNEKAMEAADHFYQTDTDIRLMKARILEREGKAEEAEKLAQRGLYDSLLNAGLFLQILASMAEEGGKTDRAMQMLETGLAMQKMFGLQEFTAQDTSYYLEKALLSAKAGNQEKALEELRTLTKRYARLARKEHWERPVYFDRLSMNRNSDYGDYLLKTARRLLEEAPEFAGLRENPRYRELYEILES